MAYWLFCIAAFSYHSIAFFRSTLRKGWVKWCFWAVHTLLKTVFESSQRITKQVPLINRGSTVTPKTKPIQSKSRAIRSPESEHHSLWKVGLTLFRKFVYIEAYTRTSHRCSFFNFGNFYHPPGFRILVLYHNK